MLRLLGTLVFGTLLLCQIVLASTMALASHTGYQVMVITGGSMEPTYHLGSALLLKELPADEIAVGDAVTFTSIEGTLTTHRVISMPHRQGEQYLQTQGDANEEPDPNFVPVGAVVGTPVTHLPYGGYVTSFLLSPLGRLLVFGPPLAALLMVQIRLIRTALRSDRDSDHSDDTGHDAPTGIQGEASIAAPVTRRAVPVSRAGFGLVPLVVVVLIGSAGAGALVAWSTATFTTVAHSTGSVLSTGASGVPVNLSADRINGRNTVSWTAPSWAPTDGYRIYRAASLGATYVAVGQVPAGQTTFTDGGGSAVSVYQVRGVSGTWLSEPAGPVGVK